MPAPRPAALVAGSLLLLALEAAGCLGAGQSGLGRQTAPKVRAQRAAFRRRLGQSDDQDDGKRGPRGLDGNKKIVGRKRHILVDTQGLLLKACVSAANIADCVAARFLLFTAAFVLTRLKLVWADSGYQGKLLGWAKQTLGWIVEIVAPPEKGKGFVLAPRRWVVERTFAWFGKWRRLSKDYEQTTKSSETFIYIAMTGLMLRRLTKD
jgi:putative transposase